MPRPARPGCRRGIALGGAAALALGLAMEPSVASAQDLQAPGFLLHRFTPATPGSDWFVLESLDFRGNLRPSVRAGFDWSQKPFVMKDATSLDAGYIVERQMFMHLGIGLNLAHRARVAVDLPIAVDQKGTGSPPINGIVYPGPGGGEVGDVRATLDLRLFGEYGDPFNLAVGTHVFFPTASGQYTSDAIVRAMPRLMMAGKAGLFSYAVNFAFLSRDQIAEEWFGGYGIGHELFGGAALGVSPVPAVMLGAELSAFTKVTDGDILKKRSTPAEVLFGAHFLVADQLRIGLGAGPGISPSKGSPEVRFLARIAWSPPIAPPDGDGDGILDAADACPTVPGPRTDDPTKNGCPLPPDRDRDGINDSDDACPDDPGIANDNRAMNGCPAPRDRDSDGVFDPTDACPDTAGVKTDDPKTNGCPPPPPDADKDGILDADDACPEKFGEKSDNPKTTGCPDGDGDGVRDPEDACPSAAGPANTDIAKNGCPLARVEKGQVRITEQVQFKSGSAVILPASNTLLEAVAKILKDNPDIKKVRIEGHTDNRGGKRMNKTLSSKRAASVARWLTTKGGVEKARLTSVGHGMDRPIGDNDSDIGRQSNRRVEFHIVDPSPDALESKPADPPKRSGTTPPGATPSGTSPGATPAGTTPTPGGAKPGTPN